MALTSSFPDLALESWKGTRDTLHAYAQVLGAVREALTPRKKHWWHTPLSVSAAGLTTTPMPAGERVVELILSPMVHHLTLVTNRSERRDIMLPGRPLSQFCEVVLAAMESMGIAPKIDRNLFADAKARMYDEAAAQRYWQVLPLIDAVMKQLKGEYRGESGPVVLWPHGFDLAVLLFSGRRVPGKDPANEEEADEQMNFGFVTGDAGISEPYFYATAYPSPPGFAGGKLPDGASWHTDGWTGAVMRYAELRAGGNAQERLLGFFRSARDAGFARMK